MSSNDKNKTVFRPSPLSRQNQTSDSNPAARPVEPNASWEPVPQETPHQNPSSVAGQYQETQNKIIVSDTVPSPSLERSDRNPLMAEAAPVLALAAAMQSGRLRIPLSEFHSKAIEGISKFEKIADRLYPESVSQSAKYAVCATIDDVIQNVPGSEVDGAQWAQRNMVVTFFKENFGGDRFLNFIKEVVKKPRQNKDLIELLHSCLAAGFEGRFRSMIDGQSRKTAAMTELFSNMEHLRGLSQTEMVQNWRGENSPRKSKDVWGLVTLAAAIVAFISFLVFLFFTAVLLTTGGEAKTRIASVFPDESVTLNRYAPVYVPAPTTIEIRLKEFLDEEIRNGLVVVEGNRVRTSVGALFAPAAETLNPGNRAIIEKIAIAAELETGAIIVEGHTDSDPIRSLKFKNSNFVLSRARAQTVANIIRNKISEPSRARITGLGDTVPLRSNTTSEGKAVNRRVEIIFEQDL